jgi:hypothetical protein
MSHALYLVSLALAAATLVAGCLPYARGYIYLDAPGIAHEEEVCQTGPPVWAVMKARNATVKVALDPGAWSRTKLPMVRLIVPQGTRIDIPEPVAYLEADGHRHAVRLQLVAAYRNYPNTAQGQRAIVMTDALRRKTGNEFYTYEFVENPTPYERGRLALPALVIEGERIELPALSFDRRASAGFVPLNC